MNDPHFLLVYLKAAIISYCCGSIPFGYIVVRLFKGEDIRAIGSGNIGATNVARSGSKGLAILTLFLDVLKGALPVFWYFHLQILVRALGMRVDINYVLGVVAALFVVLGHTFPIWLKFKGGKGVATALGVFAVLAPKAVLISLAVFVLTMAVTKYVSLGSVISTAIFPFTAYWLQVPLRTWPSMIMVTAIAMLIIIKHHGNIKRLMNGTEPKFGSKMPSVDDDAGGGA
jgi:acyl phosphate:glycerol-3-phosphate acyltransferase